MVLHTREFNVNGNSVIMGHDRETGKRYYVQEIPDTEALERLTPWDTLGPGAWENLKAIFWIH